MRLEDIFAMLSDYCPCPVEELPDYLDNGITKSDVEYENGLVIFKNSLHNIVTHWVTTPEGRLTLYIPPQSPVQYQFRDQCCTPLHCHNNIELGYVVKGQIQQIFSGRKYEFPAGSFWLSDCSSCHQDMICREDLQTVFLH